MLNGNSNLAVLYLVLVFLTSTMAIPAAAQESTKPNARFRQWDKNKDNVLTRDELPENLRKNFDRVDANGDGSISLSEHVATQKRGRNSKAMNSNAIKQNLPEGTKVHKNVVYVVGGHDRHKLDLYIPKNASTENRVPLVIWIHGGGWRNGTKDRVVALAPLAKAGFAVASINYRLSSHAQFPAQIHDCKAAIRYLRKHADNHGYDPDKFGVWGSSAGGHLVALVGTSGDVNELEGTLGVTGVSSRVQAVCDWFGPTDLLTMNAQAGEAGKIDHDAKDSPESLLIGGPIQDNKERTRKAHPTEYVTTDDPPFLIMHGDQDLLVPHQQSKALDELLDQAKVPSELIIVNGAGHGFFKDEKSRQRPIDFFTNQLMKK